jgi:hypothetical protein
MRKWSYDSAHPARHCEACGASDPGTSDGYTVCCNELVCDGSGADRWSLGFMEGRRKVRETTACCGAVAQRFAEARGLDVLGKVTPETSDCRACRTGRGRHTCGLSGLQDMLRIG